LSYPLLLSSGLATTLLLIVAVRRVPAVRILLLLIGMLSATALLATTLTTTLLLARIALVLPLARVALVLCHLLILHVVVAEGKTMRLDVRSVMGAI
jgi:hypothetical protein